MKNRYVAYGYRISGGAYTPFEAEVKAVKEIFRLYSEGYSYKTISDKMKESSSPAYSENGWNKHHIKRILENSRYTGENGYPAILTQEQYGLARAVHDKKLAGRTYGDNPALILWKHVMCGECGGKMRRIGGKLAAKGITQLRCKTPNCSYGTDIALENIYRAITYLQNEMLNASAKTSSSSYEPTAMSLRLKSQINRDIAKPDDPAGTIRLILQGISVRYKDINLPAGLPVTRKHEDENRLFEPNWELLKEAVSHIYISRTEIGLKTTLGQDFYMERNDKNANGGNPCKERSHGNTCKPFAE